MSIIDLSNSGGSGNNGNGEGGGSSIDLHINEVSLNNGILVLKDNENNEYTVDLNSFVDTDELNGFLALKADVNHDHPELKDIIYSEAEPQEQDKLWWDTKNKQLKYYNTNTQEWEPITASSGGSGYVYDIFGDSSCIACLPLNGNTDDLGGQYNAVWSGSPSYNQNKTMAFFDNKSYLKDFGFDASMAGDFAISLFILQTNASRTWSEFFHIPTTQMFGGKGQICLKNNHFNWYQTQLTDNNIDFLNNLRHIVIQRTNGTVELYIDAQRIKTQNDNNNNKIGLDSLYLGGDGGSEYLTGYIGIFRVFNRALTQDEIDTLYNEKDKL